MGAPNFSREVYFCQQYFFLETREEKKVRGTISGV